MASIKTITLRTGETVSLRDGEMTGLVNYNQRINAKAAAMGMTSIVTEMEPGGIGSDGADTGGTQHRRTKGFIPAQGGSSLYIKCDGTHSIYVRCYDANQVYQTTVSLLNSATSMEKTARLNMNIAYVRIYIVSVGVDADVYALDWAVCMGSAVITLTPDAENIIDINTLTPGEYFASSSTVQSGNLTNLPVNAGFVHIIVFPVQTSTYMAVLYSQDGSVYYTPTLGQRPWYKITGEAVTASAT